MAVFSVMASVNQTPSTVGGRVLPPLKVRKIRYVIPLGDSNMLTSLLQAVGALEGVADAVSVSPDGTILAAAGRRAGKSPGGIHTWELATGKPLRSFGGGRNWMVDLPFTPDGKRLASGGEGYTATLWDVATGREV